MHTIPSLLCPCRRFSSFCFSFFFFTFGCCFFSDISQHFCFSHLNNNTKCNVLVLFLLLFIELINCVIRSPPIRVGDCWFCASISPFDIYLRPPRLNKTTRRVIFSLPVFVCNISHQTKKFESRYIVCVFYINAQRDTMGREEGRPLSTHNVPIDTHRHCAREGGRQLLPPCAWNACVSFVRL